VEAATFGMFRFGLDPFSSYVPPDFADRLDALGSGRVDTLGLVVGGRDGDGAACSPVGETCLFRVLAVFPFTAAEREGVVAGDAILAVDGEVVAGLSTDEATARLIGDPGTTVTLTLDREVGRIDKALVHEDIRYEPAEYEMLTSSVAYLRLNDFSQIAAQLLGRVLELGEVRRSRGLILDLRDNPGGLVLAAQAVASQFLEGGLVMREESAEDAVDVPVVDGGLAPRLRLVVLVNRGSASASEIVAAVLQERGRATVVGEPTFGKNLVQQVFSAGNGGEIRVTVARWTTPEGTDIGVRGLTPDVIVADPPDATGDPALEAAVALLGG
jgi:carboxyl-terminal processing protease